METIDSLLARFEQEIAWFVETRDALQPVLETLDACLRAHFAAPSVGTLSAVREARARYVTELRRLDPLLRDWVAIRGSAELLWAAGPAMSDAHAARFDALVARELAVTWDREEFDTLLDAVRRGLLVFEEATA